MARKKKSLGTKLREAQDRRISRRERRQDRNREWKLKNRESKYNYGLLGLAQKKMEHKTERVHARQDRWTENVRNRTHAREVKFQEKGESDRTAYENGMDPNEWKGNAIIAGIGGATQLGSKAMEVFGGRMGRRDRSNMTDAELAAEMSPDEIMNNRGVGAPPKSGIIIAAVVGIGLAIIGVFTLIFKPRKRRK